MPNNVESQHKHMYIFFIIPHATSCGGYNVFDPSVSLVFLVSATPLKPLNRIVWNFVVIKDIMCRCAYPQEILIPFFSRIYALFELRNLAKMKDTTETVGQHNSTETAQQNCVKRTLCVDMHLYRKCWFNPFEEHFISPFLSDCPSLMLGIAIHCIQPSQAMLERGVCPLAYSFFLTFKLSGESHVSITNVNMI